METPRKSLKSQQKERKNQLSRQRKRKFKKKLFFQYKKIEKHGESNGKDSRAWSEDSIETPFCCPRRACRTRCWRPDWCTLSTGSLLFYSSIYIYSIYISIYIYSIFSLLHFFYSSLLYSLFISSIFLLFFSFSLSVLRAVLSQVLQGLAAGSQSACILGRAP